jgi:hypothetical protein
MRLDGLLRDPLAFREGSRAFGLWSVDRKVELGCTDHEWSCTQSCESVKHGTAVWQGVREGQGAPQGTRESRVRSGPKAKRSTDHTHESTTSRETCRVS